MLYDVMTQENQNLQADSEVSNSEFHKQQDTPNGNYVQIRQGYSFDEEDQNWIAILQ